MHRGFACAAKVCAFLAASSDSQDVLHGWGVMTLRDLCSQLPTGEGLSCIASLDLPREKVGQEGCRYRRTRVANLQGDAETPEPETVPDKIPEEAEVGSLLWSRECKFELCSICQAAADVPPVRPLFQDSLGGRGKKRCAQGRAELCLGSQRSNCWEVWRAPGRGKFANRCVVLCNVWSLGPCSCSRLGEREKQGETEGQ